MDEQRAIDGLYRILSAIYLTAPVSDERLAAWRTCVGDLEPRLLVAVIDDAARLWPDRLPTMAQIRAEVLLRKRDEARAQAPQVAAGPMLGAEDLAWNAAHPDSPWVQLSQLWSEYPRGGPRPPKVGEKERALLKTLGIGNASPQSIVGALARSV